MTTGLHSSRRRPTGGQLLRWISWLTLGLLLLAGHARAFDVSFDIQPRVLRLGEAASGSFTVMGLQDPPLLQFPSVDGLQIAQAGTQRSFSFGNGGGSSSFTYQYQILPTRTGKISIGPFTYDAEGQTVNLPAIEIEVMPPDGNPAAGGQPQDWSELLFARITIDETTLYHQQLFSVTFAIYSRGLNMARDISLMNMPSSGGLSIGTFREIQGGREIVDNQVYDVRRFRAQAQALGSGTFKLEPVLQVHLVVPRERRRSRDPFGMFDDSFPFFGNTQTQPVDVKPPPVEITARPLPTEGQPASFAGAVGQFNFDMQAKPLDLNVGDPITLTLQIAGHGNIEAIGAPAFAGSSDQFKIYEPKLLGKEMDEGSGNGRKVFEQVVIPKNDTIKELPALTFSFFDPAGGQYRTVTRGPFPLAVHPSTAGNARLLQADLLSQPETQVLGADIVYLKSAPAGWTRSTGTGWIVHPAFWMVQTVPLMAAGILWAFVRRRNELSVNVAKARRQKAPRSAQAAVRKAETALAHGQRKAYFEALWEAIASYFGHRLNLAPGAVSMETIGAAMSRGGLEPAGLQWLQDLYARCEQERFGAGSASGTPLAPDEKQELSQLLDRLNDTLKACEKVRI